MRIGVGLAVMAVQSLSEGPVRNPLLQNDYFFRLASRLHGPAPAAEKKSQMKQ